MSFPFKSVFHKYNQQIFRNESCRSFPMHKTNRRDCWQKKKGDCCVCCVRVGPQVRSPYVISMLARPSPKNNIAPFISIYHISTVLVPAVEHLYVYRIYGIYIYSSVSRALLSMLRCPSTLAAIFVFVFNCTGLHLSKAGQQQERKLMQMTTETTPLVYETKKE